MFVVVPAIGVALMGAYILGTEVFVRHPSAKTGKVRAFFNF